MQLGHDECISTSDFCSRLWILIFASGPNILILGFPSLRRTQTTGASFWVIKAQGPELASSSPLAFMFSSHLRDEACVELDTCKS